MIVWANKIACKLLNFKRASFLGKHLLFLLLLLPALEFRPQYSQHCPHSFISSAVLPAQTLILTHLGPKGLKIYEGQTYLKVPTLQKGGIGRLDKNQQSYA